VRLLGTMGLRNVGTAIAVPAGCSSVTRDYESSASAEIETWRLDVEAAVCGAWRRAETRDMRCFGRAAAYSKLPIAWSK
jgi:hypothetical protein